MPKPSSLLVFYSVADKNRLLLQIDQSQEPSDVQMRQTIYSLLAQEGTLESQMVRVHREHNTHM